MAYKCEHASGDRGGEMSEAGNKPENWGFFLKKQLISYFACLFIFKPQRLQEKECEAHLYQIVHFISCKDLS